MNKKILTISLMAIAFVVSELEASSLILGRLSVVRQAALTAIRPLSASTRVFAVRGERKNIPMNSQDDVQKIKNQIEELQKKLAEKEKNNKAPLGELVSAHHVSPQFTPAQDPVGITFEQRDALYKAKHTVMWLFLKMHDNNNLFPRWNPVGTYLRENKIASLLEYLEKEGQKTFIKDFSLIQAKLNDGTLLSKSIGVRTCDLPDGEAKNLLERLEYERKSDKFWNKWFAVDAVTDLMRDYMWYDMGKSAGRREAERQSQQPTVSDTQPVKSVDPIAGSSDVPPVVAKQPTTSSSEELFDTAKISNVEDAPELADTAQSIGDSSAAVSETAASILGAVGDIFKDLGD